MGTLTTTCASLFAPGKASFLKPVQCLMLQGHDVHKLPLQDFTDRELTVMAGMAMSVPVVGSLMWAVATQLHPA